MAWKTIHELQPEMRAPVVRRILFSGKRPAECPSIRFWSIKVRLGVAGASSRPLPRVVLEADGKELIATGVED